MKFIKVGRILAGVMLVFSLTVMPTPARAGEGGTTTGEFQVGGAAPIVYSVELLIAGGSGTSSMSPQMEYSVEVGVSDANLLDDLSTVTLRIFYDADGSYSAGEEAGAANTQSRAILTWEKDGSSWSIDPSANTTWALGSCVQPTLDAGSGIFEFLFRPGKVATETTGNARWHIYVEADDGEATDTANVTNNTMNWYGEIAVPSATIDWDVLLPGTDFGESTKQTGISVNYTANGLYYEKVATSANWTSGSDNATLDVSGNCTNTNEFSLMADDTATLGSAELVSPTYVVIDNTGTQTTEDGDTVTTNTLWLKLSPVFLAETYSGDIHFQIANRD